MLDPGAGMDGEGSGTRDARALGERVREVILTGRLPRRPPDRIWGGPGVGALCVVCGSPVTRGQLELEVEFARNGPGSGADQYHVHIACFQAWESELQKREPTGEAAGTPP
jgi:hypothetical protein